MKSMKRRIAKSALLGIGLVLALLSINGRSVVSADVPDVSIEQTCSPKEFRPNEWVVHECLITVTNTGTGPVRDFVSSLTRSSGVRLDVYFVLFTADGAPLPIEPTLSQFGVDGELAPGASVRLRLVVLLRSSEEGVYDAVWTTRHGGQVMLEDPKHYEIREEAALPPKDLSVEQASRSQGTQAVFTTTITNNSASPVTQLSVMEHYGPNGVLPTRLRPQWQEEYPGGANLTKWDLASLGLDELRPGETLTLETAYDSNGADFVQSGVVVQATVNGEEQSYGASAGSVSVVRNEQGAQPAVARVPATGEGPDKAADRPWLAASLLAGGVALITTAFITRRRRSA
jgi:hypothetical protein